MKYTAEEVRQYARITDGMVSVPKLTDMLTELAERIKADEGAVTETVLDQACFAAVNRDSGTMERHVRASYSEQLAFREAMRAALLAVWPTPPAQAAQVESDASMAKQVLAWMTRTGSLSTTWGDMAALSQSTAEPVAPIDLAAVREVIASHIEEAKKLRHDPESQDYLYEQAGKLEAALQEKGNGA